MESHNLDGGLINKQTTDFNNNKKFLIIGNCGVGKTWIMKQLITKLNLTEKGEHGLVRYVTNGNTIVTGVYNNEVFDGSDKLSMAVMRDVVNFVEKNNNKTIIFEGDRFTNGNFIEQVKPIILKVMGDGIAGRQLRGSQQSDTHIKSIATRVSNLQYDYSFSNSQLCLEFIIGYYGGNDIQKTIIEQPTLF